MGRSFEVKVAEREKLKFSGLYMGATGSGKTVGALITAKGLVHALHPDLNEDDQTFWDKIGIVDTEHNRSKIYADTTIGGEYLGKFRHIDFRPPYDVESYIDAVNALKEMGCVIVIVDSLSHSWDSTGGILEVHQNMGGTFGAWQKVNPIIKKLYAAVAMDEDLHLITTVRSKMKYEASTSETGKMEVSKIGLKPIMRDDFEYEVLTALHFNEEHKVTIIKDNTQVFDNGVHMKSAYGTELFDFLNKGIDLTSLRKEKLKTVKEEIAEMLNEHGEKRSVKSLMKVVEQQSMRKYNSKDWKELPMASLLNVLDKLKELIKE